MGVTKRMAHSAKRIAKNISSQRSAIIGFPLPYILRDFCQRIKIFLKQFMLVVLKVKLFIASAETSLSQKTGGSHAAVSAGRSG